MAHHKQTGTWDQRYVNTVNKEASALDLFPWAPDDIFQKRVEMIAEIVTCEAVASEEQVLT